MSYDLCGREWIGDDGKDHRCQVMVAAGHSGPCTCDCGATTGNPIHQEVTPIKGLLQRTKKKRTRS
jgi:hypothetical protein